MVAREKIEREDQFQRLRRSSTKTVERPALPLERIHDVKRGDGLTLRVLSVRDGITDDRFQKRFEHAASLFVDHR